MYKCPPDVGSEKATRYIAAACLLGALAGTILDARAGNDSVAVAGSPAFEVESKIALGDIRGRIDHLAIDVARQRVYVAELGNDTVGVVDLNERKTIRTLAGLRKPQGIAYVPSTDTVYVANAGDGSVRLFQGSDLAPAGQIALGSDADNVRADDRAGRLYVGYGDGALAVIDVMTRLKVRDIPLKAHPESFALESAGTRIFVNMPGVHAIAVIDRTTDTQIASWQTGDLRANFPLALDDSGHVLAVFRHPASLGVFRTKDGRLLASLETCADSDDVFADTKRRRIYVICGEGFIDTMAQDADQFRRISRIPTHGGARTGIYVPVIDRLLLAVRSTTSEPAALWVLRPVT